MHIKPDYSSTPEPFRHTWEGLGNIDQFRWFIRADTLEQLELAHKELGLRHVRAVGMFDDEMRVLTPDPTKWHGGGQLADAPNWQINTAIIERLLAIGIRPMITTCFMPTALASGVRTVFETQSNISLPKDWDAWRNLVHNLVTHLVEHFGIEMVRSFYFEVWNEPNLENNFFEGSMEDFFKLYYETVSVIKSIDPLFKVGGPSTARAEWIPEFLEFCRKHDMEPDYLIGHIYNNDSDSKPLSPFDGPQEDQTSKSPNFASGVIRGTRKLLDDAGFKGEVHWNEWGRSWFPCEPVRETANEAAFIVKTMAEVSQLADYFAYWCLSDIYNQVGYGNSAFHGNYGLLSLNGLRKPGYLAFQLLSRLGDKRIEVSGSNLDLLNNAIATPNAVLVYKYDPDEAPVVAPGRITVSIPSGAKVKSVFRITSTENNILHRWRMEGSPKYLKQDVLKRLQKENVLKATTDYTSGQGAVSFDLETPGVALVEFE